MPAPDIDSSAFSIILPGLIPRGALKRGGQKLVLPCELNGETMVVKALELRVGLSTSQDEEETLEIDDVLERVRREILVLSRCDSPHVVKLGPVAPFDTVHGGKRLFFFSEELIDGEDLSELVCSGPLQPSEVVKVGLDVCTALECLLAQDVLHRDLKPQNIMKRTSTSDFVLLDMGIAFDFGARSLTSTGLVVGSIPYLSPERLDLARKRELDLRSEFFSLGITLYQASTGRHPFRTNDRMSEQQMIRNIMSQNPVAPIDVNPNIPVGLSETIMRMLEKKPHQRYRNIVLLREALTNSLNRR